MKISNSDFETMDTDECPYYLLTRASLSITADFKKSFTNAGISHVKPAYLGVLMCLWREDSLDEALGKLGNAGGVKIAELGRCAGLEPSTMTGLIDRMERDGLVSRSDDPDDRRALNIRLTDEGVRIRSGIVKTVGETLRGSFAGIEPGDLKIFREVLRRVLMNTHRRSNPERNRESGHGE